MNVWMVFGSRLSGVRVASHKVDKGWYKASVMYILYRFSVQYDLCAVT